MNYQETLDYMFSQLPMFQRTGKAAYKANLDNTLALDAYFKHPHQQFKSIHVAGTNGKGSVSHYLASVLQSAGFKVGLYTSPHLRDFRERIKINGQPIPEAEVVDFVADHKQLFTEIRPSFFEMTVAMAFDYFARQKVDYAIVEVGLGGRLDSTNIISPLLSVITNISLDHTNLLGDSVEKIAVEKAGIIKKGIPVVVGERQKGVDDIFIQRAEEMGTSLYFACDELKIQSSSLEEQYRVLDIEKGRRVEYAGLRSDLLGIYQQKNLLTALCALEELEKQGIPVGKEAIYSGISKVISQTGLMGRWYQLATAPLTICDTGHNEAGIRDILSQLEVTPFENLHMVIGMVDDKNVEEILKMLPRDAKYYFTRAKIPRALDQNILKEKAESVGLKGDAYASVKEAVGSAKQESSSDDLIFIGGSTFVVAEVV
jgi:dihydrofolate synthase/folylpolyglutamate synthase